MGVAVIVFGARNFLRILESSGEALGDEFLKLCAERISMLVHGYDVVARLDENRLVFTMAYCEPQLEINHVLRNMVEALSQ